MSKRIKHAAKHPQAIIKHEFPPFPMRLLLIDMGRALGRWQ